MLTLKTYLEDIKNNKDIQSISKKVKGIKIIVANSDSSSEIFSIFHQKKIIGEITHLFNPKKYILVLFSGPFLSRKSEKFVDIKVVEIVKKLKEFVK